jgi:hypothetical protein
VVDSLDGNAGFALVLSEAAAMRSVRRPPLGVRLFHIKPLQACAPLGGQVTPPERRSIGDDPRTLSKEKTMKSYAFFVRLAVLISLVLTSLLMAGWKWEHVA